MDDLSEPDATRPGAIVLAGANGAGKTTASPFLLRDELRVATYVDADVIARGLSAFAAESVARAAGEALLAQLDRLEAAHRSFAFESTLAGRTHAKRIRRLIESGYHVRIFYLWLPSPELAVARVKLRARHGGHDIAEHVIRRRYQRSLCNFVELYAPLVSTWHVYDASGALGAAGVPLIARGQASHVDEVRDSAVWNQILRNVRIREVGRTRYGRIPDDAELQRRLDLAMTRAFRAAVRLHRRHGLPLALWLDGGLRHVDARHIPLPEDDTSRPAPDLQH
jgi:predicted ABC-type ATPase